MFEICEESPYVVERTLALGRGQGACGRGTGVRSWAGGRGTGARSGGRGTGRGQGAGGRGTGRGRGHGQVGGALGEVREIKSFSSPRQWKQDLCTDHRCTHICIHTGHCDGCHSNHGGSGSMHHEEEEFKRCGGYTSSSGGQCHVVMEVTHILLYSFIFIAYMSNILCRGRVMKGTAHLFTKACRWQEALNRTAN